MTPHVERLVCGMTDTPALILPSQVETWPTAIDPFTGRQFTPAFLYRTGSDGYWTISSETDGQGHVAGSVGFNPARWPQWVMVEVDDEAAERSGGLS